MKKSLVLSVMLFGTALGFCQATNSRVLYTTTSDKHVGSSIRTVPYNPSTKQYNLDVKREAAMSASSLPTPSGKTAVYHGETIPVYTSSRGKEYINVTSKKTGNVYKKYIN